MKSRRGRREGSVYKRADGQWCGSVTIGYDQKGRRRRRTVYGRAKGDVIEKLARLQGDVFNGTLVAVERATVAQFLERWVEDAARPTVRLSTYDLYSWLIKKHINPRIGGVRLTSLGPIELQGMFSSMERDGLSPRMRQIIYARLHKAFGQAVRWGLVPRNVCDAIDRPRAPRKQFTVLNHEQVARFLHVGKTDRLYALYLLGVASGLREGELLGLHWDCLDFSKRVTKYMPVREPRWHGV